MAVCITNYGGRIVSVMVPDKDGIMRDVVLGFDSIQDYIKYPSDFGASIGRYANRINPVSYTHLDVYKRQVLEERRREMPMLGCTRLIDLKRLNREPEFAKTRCV